MNGHNVNANTDRPDRPETGADVCGSKYRLTEVRNGFREGGLRCKGAVKSSRAGSPLVSIITVVRNGMPYIGLCIDSVLKQTYDNIEYIIIDGCSEDGTLEILERYRDNIDYYASAPDDGIYNAMNKGLELASGDFIIFLNSDDRYDKETIKKLVNKLSENQADVAYADAYVVDVNEVIQYRLDSWFNVGLYTRGAPIRHETMLVGKHVYNKLGGYDESYKIISDYEFMIRLYESDFKCTHLKEPLLYFRNTGISNTGESLRQNERLMIFRERFPFLDNDALEILKKHGQLSITTRLRLLMKYSFNSWIFTASMAFNMLASLARHLKRI